MGRTSIKSTLAGFIGGVAFIIGCGGGGGEAGSNTTIGSNNLLNNAMAAETQKVQDIEEMNCKISPDGVSSPSGHISSTIGSYYISSDSSTQTFTERYPNHIVYCATLGASSYTEYTLTSLKQGGWKTYNYGGTYFTGYQAKVWRAVLR